jgi:hypothetical protein
MLGPPYCGALRTWGTLGHSHHYQTQCCVNCCCAEFCEGAPCSTYPQGTMTIEQCIVSSLKICSSSALQPTLGDELPLEMRHAAGYWCKFT